MKTNDDAGSRRFTGVAARAASTLRRHGVEPDLLDDLVHDYADLIGACSRRASQANNDGLAEQVEFLILAESPNVSAGRAPALALGALCDHLRDEVVSTLPILRHELRAVAADFEVGSIFGHAE